MTQPTEEQQERAQAYARIIHAYGVVFGRDDESRTPQQKAVWADLRNICYVDRAVFVPQPGIPLDPLRAAMTDGRRSVFLDIEKEINKNLESKKPKPEVIK